MTGLRIVAMIVIAFLATPGYAADCDLADLDEAKALALKAADLLEKEGPENALVKFMEPGPFIDRDLYVFVLDMEGTLWALWFPEKRGSRCGCYCGRPEPWGRPRDPLRGSHAGT